MGLWHHHPGRGFRAQLLPGTSSCVFSKTLGVLLRGCWLFLPSLALLRARWTPCLCEGQDLTNFILLVAVLYPLSSLAEGVWTPLLKIPSPESCSKCQSLPFFHLLLVQPVFTTVGEVCRLVYWFNVICKDVCRRLCCLRSLLGIFST